MDKRKFARITNKKGESMIYVMSVMFFLIVICMSISAAASTSMRYSVNQREHTQAMIMAESVHQNIMYSLQHDPNDPASLGYYISRQVFNHLDGLTPPQTTATNPMSDIILNLNFADGINDAAFYNSLMPMGPATVNITLVFPAGQQHISPLYPVYRPAVFTVEETTDRRYIPPPPASPLYTLDETTSIKELTLPRQPKSADISAIMEVYVEIGIDNNKDGTPDRTVTSKAVYFYQGSVSDCLGIIGECIDDPVSGATKVEPGDVFEVRVNGVINPLAAVKTPTSPETTWRCCATDLPTVGLGLMEFDDYGKWVLERYERVD